MLHNANAMRHCENHVNLADLVAALEPGDNITIQKTPDGKIRISARLLPGTTIPDYSIPAAIARDTEVSKIVDDRLTELGLL